MLRFLGALAVAGCLQVPPPAGPREATVAPEPAGPVEYWAGKAVGELYKVGEVRAFAFVQEGQTIGHSWGRYDGPVERDGATLHRFSTRIELQLPNRPVVRSEGRIVVDGRGDLIEGFERSDAAQVEFSVERGLLTMSVGRETEEIAFDPGTAYMAFMATMHEEIMFGIRRLASDTLSWRLVSLSGGLPAEWEADVEDHREGRTVLRTSLGEKITLQGGRLVRVEVEEDNLEVLPDEDGAWPTWSIAGPEELTYSMQPDASFKIREVDLPGRPGEPAIYGEVLVPKDATQPRPAVLFVAAGGHTDRYGFAGPPPVDLGYHQITDALAEAGFVVLRYDEPGFGKSDEAELSWKRQLEDARRGVRTLLVQPEVDPDRVVVVGHGEALLV